MTECVAFIVEYSNLHMLETNSDTDSQETAP